MFPASGLTVQLDQLFVTQRVLQRNRTADLPAHAGGVLSHELDAIDTLVVIEPVTQHKVAVAVLDHAAAQRQHGLPERLLPLLGREVALCAQLSLFHLRGWHLQPLHAQQVMLKVVVSPRVRRTGDDAVDRTCCHRGERSCVLVEQCGLWNFGELELHAHLLVKQLLRLCGHPACHRATRILWRDTLQRSVCLEGGELDDEAGEHRPQSVTLRSGGQLINRVNPVQHLHKEVRWVLEFEPINVRSVDWAFLPATCLCTLPDGLQRPPNALGVGFAEPAAAFLRHKLSNRIEVVADHAVPPQQSFQQHGASAHERVHHYRM